MFLMKFPLIGQVQCEIPPERKYGNFWRAKIPQFHVFWGFPQQTFREEGKHLNLQLAITIVVPKFIAEPAPIEIPGIKLYGWSASGWTGILNLNEAEMDH